VIEVEVDHLPDIHPVYVVGTEHQDQVRMVAGNQVQVLADGVGGALEPVRRSPSAAATL
jgi:hypothetical protein